MLYFFYYFFFIYIKMSKTLWAKYYQENKDYKKKLVKDIKIFLKKKGGNVCQRYNLPKGEKQKLVEYRKKNKEQGKTFYYNYKKVF